MLKIFDMMYYHLATFNQRFSKKTSGWQLQAILIITVTQFMLLLDFWMIIISIFDITGKVSIYEKIIFTSMGLILLFYNMKRYEKKYQYYKSIWGNYTGIKKRIQIFLSFFIVVFAWTFVFILGFIFDKY
jgi:hypothetical protein